MSAVQSHTQHCDHSHGGSDGTLSDRKMGLAVAITLMFVVGELIAGTVGHSLALLSDAGHNFADAAALGFSWYALRIARRPADGAMTFGYHRVGILAALINAVSLVVIALAIGWGAVQRLVHPVTPSGGLMIAVASVAIVLNGVIGMWLHHGAQHDLNLRGAYLHMLGDAIAAAGVVLAGTVVALFGWPLTDPIVSFVIGGLILFSSLGILKESVNVLLEGAPRKLDTAAVLSEIEGISGVLGAHHLHVWTVGPGAVACSCHIIVGEQTVRKGRPSAKVWPKPCEIASRLSIRRCRWSPRVPAAMTRIAPFELRLHISDITTTDVGVDAPFSGLADHPNKRPKKPVG